MPPRYLAHLHNCPFSRYPKSVAVSKDWVRRRVVMAAKHIGVSDPLICWTEKEWNAHVPTWNQMQKDERNTLYGMASQDAWAIFIDMKVHQSDPALLADTIAHEVLHLLREKHNPAFHAKVVKMRKLLLAA